MIRVMSVVGARPQFIKAAVVSRAMAQTGAIAESMVHTGQHSDFNMSQVFFDELRLPAPAHHFDLGGGTHAQQVGGMLPVLESVMTSERPDWVLVYGDTNTTMAGALSAAKLAIPVAHVEAGLRCFNPAVPEEINRVVTDRVSSLLFAPTATAVNNLRAEGFTESSVRLVGDVMYDAALSLSSVAERTSTIAHETGLDRGDFILVTIHRQENTDDPEKLSAILDALQALAADIPVVLPLHPRTRQRLAELGRSGAGRDGLKLLPPLSYFDMLALLKRARLVATDSGGLQKEAYFFRVPCVTLRAETEWVELVERGWSRLCEPVSAGIVVDCIRKTLSVPLPSEPDTADALYGSGKASFNIAQILVRETERRNSLPNACRS